MVSKFQIFLASTRRFKVPEGFQLWDITYPKKRFDQLPRLADVSLTMKSRARGRLPDKTGKEQAPPCAHQRRGLRCLDVESHPRQLFAASTLRSDESRSRVINGLGLVVALKSALRVVTPITPITTSGGPECRETSELGSQEPTP